MATSSITIRMDDTLKQQFEGMLDDMGMNMTTAVILYAKAVIRMGKIPFEIVADPFWNDANQARLKEAIAQLEAGEGKAHDPIEVDDGKNVG